LDGKPVSRPEAFTRTIQAYKPGEQITLTVYRRGEDKPLELQVTLAEHPDEAGKGYLGVILRGFFQKDRSPTLSN
jgi:S1-C subfamily serine protease